MPTISQQRELVQIRAAWIRLNDLDELWSREVERRRAADERQATPALDAILRDMQKLLDAVPPQSRRVERGLDDDAIQAMSHQLDLLEDPAMPERARIFAKRIREKEGPA